MAQKLSSLLIFIVVAITGCKVTSEKTSTMELPYLLGEILFTDGFSDDLSRWHAEGTQPRLVDGRMELDAPVGTTVWFSPRLFGNVLIEYDVTVIDSGGANDRVSDLNCFWMATDPANPDNLFELSEQRGGTFKNYDNLNLYYAGYGGNTNTTTRFRRYCNSDRVLLGEYTDSNHLIIPNHTYHIRLVVFENVIEYYIDGERLFHYYDAEPFREGHFGLRTVKNHLAMDNFRIVRIRQNRD